MAVHVSLSKQDRVTDAVNESIIRMTADAMFAQKKSEGTYPKTPLSSSGDYLIIGQQAPVPVRFGSGNTASGGEVTVWVKDSTDVLCITVNSPNADEVSAEVSPARSGNDITITYVTACEPTR